MCNGHLAVILYDLKMLTLEKCFFLRLLFVFLGPQDLIAASGLCEHCVSWKSLDTASSTKLCCFGHKQHWQVIPLSPTSVF